MLFLGLVVVVASNSTLRALLESVFADLCWVWAQDLNVLSGLTCVLACVLLFIDRCQRFEHGSEMVEVQQTMEGPDAVRETPQVSRPKKAVASKAVLGALVGFNGLAAAQGLDAHSCHAISAASVQPQMNWNDFSLMVDLENVTFDCLSDTTHTVERFSLYISPAFVADGIPRIECKGSEEVCSSLGTFEVGDEWKFAESYHGIEAPTEEWKQILIFVVCFLGIGALLEILLILFLSRSLTSILRKRELNYAVPVSSIEPELGRGLLAERGPSLVAPSQTSIFASEIIPIHAKVLVPFFLCVTIGGFVAANTNVGATVEMLVKYELKPWVPFVHTEPIDKMFGPFYLFQFSLVNTIREMYKAGVYILALLVLVWSGIWPYLKLLLLLIAWFIPPSKLSTTTRGRMLLVFDALGKWCMIDIFLMVMMSVAFRFHIDSSSIPHIHWILPRQMIVLDVIVTSEYGIFGFVGAAMLSLIMNHVVLAYHRTALSNEVSKLITDELQSLHGSIVVDADMDGANEDKMRNPYCCPCPTGSWYGVGSDEVITFDHVLNRKESIISHIFRVKGGGRLRIGWTTQVSIVVLLVLSMLLTLVGALTESFEFTFTGLAGKAIALVQPESVVRRYSLVSIANSMNPGNQTLDPQNPVGILFLQSIYLMFALVMPLVQCIFMLALWLVPMRLRDQKIVFDTTEMISSWAALDCFIVSIIAACVEINQFAQFLVGDRCDFLKHFTEEQCFGIKTSFLSGCWVVVVAASLLFISSQTVARICERVIHDRELDVLEMRTDDQVSERDVPSGLTANFLWEVESSD